MHPLAAPGMPSNTPPNLAVENSIQRRAVAQKNKILRVQCTEPWVSRAINKTVHEGEAMPLVIIGCEEMWGKAQFTMENFAVRYGDRYTKWHHAGNGARELPHISRQRSMDKYIKVKDAIAKIIGISQKSDAEDSDAKDERTPTYFREKCDSTKFGAQLLSTIFEYGASVSTPLYTIASSTGQFMEPTFEAMSDGSAPAYKKDFSGFVTALFEDGVLHTPGQEYFHARVPETDLYFGAILSGSSPHSHGLASTSTTGTKLWMLYSPDRQCALGRSMRDAGLLPRCRSNLEKFSEDGPPCLEQLHSLELLCHYDDLQRLGAEPLLYIQSPGEHIIIPEGWMHATINLEPQVTLAHRYPIERGRTVQWREEQLCPARQLFLG